MPHIIFRLRRCINGKTKPRFIETRGFLLRKSLPSNLLGNDFRVGVPKIKLNGSPLQLTKIYVYFLWLANIA